MAQFKRVMSTLVKGLLAVVLVVAAGIVAWGALRTPRASTPATITA